MRWLIAVMLAVSMAAPSQAATVTFRSTVADFHNPERGFWRQPNGDFLAATPDELDDTARYGTLAHAMVRLDDYRHADLPPGEAGEFVARLQEGDRRDDQRRQPSRGETPFVNKRN